MRDWFVFWNWKTFQKSTVLQESTCRLIMCPSVGFQVRKEPISIPFSEVILCLSLHNLISNTLQSIAEARPYHLPSPAVNLHASSLHRQLVSLSLLVFALSPGNPGPEPTRPTFPHSTCRPGICPCDRFCSSCRALKHGSAVNFGLPENLTSWIVLITAGTSGFSYVS